MNDNDKDKIVIPEFVQSKDNTSKNISPFDYYSSPKFFNGSRLFADCFRLFISIGEENCIKRELSAEELQKMQKAYINHCHKNHYTEADFMNTLYAYELYSIESEQEKRLSGKEKFALKRDLARAYNYKGALFKSGKIKDIRHIPFSKDRKKSLHLSDFFSKQFAKTNVDRQSDKVTYINKKVENAHKQKINENKEELRTLYRPIFREHLTYNPPLSAKTKKGFMKLAAFSLGGLIMFNGFQAHLDNQLYKNTTLESAIEAGLDYSDLGLSSSLTEQQIQDSQSLSFYSDEHAPIIDILQEGGSIGLYEDITQKLELYQNEIPSAQEESLLIKEIQCLPEAIFLDKTIQAYNDAHKDDEDFKPAAAATLHHYTGDGDSFSDSYSVELFDEYGYNFFFDRVSGMHSLLGLLPTRVQDFSDLDENIDSLASDIKQINSDLDNNEISVYNRAEKVSEHLSKMEEYVEAVMDFAARDFEIKKTITGQEYLEIEGHEYEKSTQNDSNTINKEDDDGR